jgi:hypothetical protein
LDANDLCSWRPWNRSCEQSGTCPR